jgi:hypothetical protein
MIDANEGCEPMISLAIHLTPVLLYALLALVIAVRFLKA